MSEQKTTAPVEKIVRIFHKGSGSGRIHCRGFDVGRGEFHEVPESVAKILFEHREAGGTCPIVEASSVSKVAAAEKAESERLSAENATLLERIKGLERQVAEQQAAAAEVAPGVLPEPIERVRRSHSRKS